MMAHPAAKSLHSSQSSTLRSLLVLHDHLHLLGRMRRKAVHDPRDFRMKLASSHLSCADAILLSEHRAGQKKHCKAQALSPSCTVAFVELSRSSGSLLSIHQWHALSVGEKVGDTVLLHGDHQRVHR